jgi:hypothetical protein
MKMRHIRLFEEFVNEGLIGLVSKTLNPGKIDNIVKSIKDEIINNFNYDNLVYRGGSSSAGLRFVGLLPIPREYDYFDYTTENGDRIHSEYDVLYLNDKDITSITNKYLIIDINKFLNKKYQDYHKELGRVRQREKDIKDRELAQHIRNEY